MTESLRDRVAIVTGAGRGIGAATARLLAEDGARVVLVSRTERELAGVARSIAERVGDDRALVVPADVADEAAVARVFEDTARAFGDLHIVVNNAGIFRSGAVEELSVANWDEVMAVNARGPFLMSREAFRRFRALGHGGAIVNVASLGGLRGILKFQGFVAYTVSKSAIIGLTECLAVEGRGLRVRVNAIAPGAVDTRMLREAAPFLRTETSPEDVARAIRFLCDDFDSASVTGAVLEIHSNL